MTTLKITISAKDDLRDNALDHVRAVDESDEPRDMTETATIGFPSYAVLTKHLTPTRLELVQAIAQHSPESVSGAADIVGRDVGDVSRDIQRLDSIGVIDVEEGGPGKPTKPLVPYDRIEIEVDYPLVDGETDPKESSATAG